MNSLSQTQVKPLTCVSRLVSGDWWQFIKTDYVFSTMYWVVYRLASGEFPYSGAEQKIFWGFWYFVFLFEQLYLGITTYGCKFFAVTLLNCRSPTILHTMSLALDFSWVFQPKYKLPNVNWTLYCENILSYNVTDWKVRMLLSVVHDALPLLKY